MNSPATGAKLLVNRDHDFLSPFVTGQGKTVKTLWDFFFKTLGGLLKSAKIIVYLGDHGDISILL